MLNVELDPTNWLARRVPRFHSLTDTAKQSISHFCLLWGLFEGRCLHENGSVQEIKQFVVRISDKLEGLDQLLNTTQKYFCNRYVNADGHFTDRFEKLCFRGNDRREDVEAVLLGSQKDKLHVMAAVLIIIYRLRNNLFHGPKWQYEITEQEENFLIANMVLMTVMDVSDADIKN